MRFIGGIAVAGVAVAATALATYLHVPTYSSGPVLLADGS